MIDVGKWAEHLLDAEERREAGEPITATEAGLSVDDGYAIQRELVDRRLKAGERLVGAKLGLTSKAKQQAMGVDEPLFAWLTDAMLLPGGSPLVVSELIHPRVEPEVVFVMGRDLAGPGVTVDDVLAATASVCCGLEVIDSRYADFRFTLADVVADNASSARFVLGDERLAPDPHFDLAEERCVLECDGEVVDEATGAAVLGHPAEAVALLANRLGRQGRHLEAGWIVLSGGLTNAVPMAAGTSVTATFDRLGSVSLRGVA